MDSPGDLERQRAVTEQGGAAVRRVTEDGWMRYSDHMARLALLAAMATLSGCRSSAPYTIPSAMLNSAMAVGASAGQRAAGGCFAACAYGTACNPATGLCERVSEACAGREETDPRCAPAVPIAPLSVQQEGPAASGGALVPGLGVSPATGRAPSPPGELPSLDTR